MIHIKKLLLVITITSLGSIIHGMEKEQPSFSELPIELRHDIASLLLEKELGYNYGLFRTIEVRSPVYSVAFSPDGKSVLTGSLNPTVKLWDVESGELLKEFKGHTGIVESVAFSPDGNSVLTGSQDGTARLWNIQSGEQTNSFNGKANLTFIGQTKGVNSVAFSPDGNTILTGSLDCTARLWDVGSVEQLKIFEGHTSYIISVAFSKDGEMIAIGSYDVGIFIYKRSKRSEEKIKEQFKKREKIIKNEFQEKIKFLLNPVGNRNEEVDIEVDAPKECIIQ